MCINKHKIRHKDRFEQKAYSFNLIMIEMFPHTSGTELVSVRAGRIYTT